MKAKYVSLAVAATLLISSGIAVAIDKQQDRLRIHTDDPLYLEVKEQKRLQIYGSELMTPQERAEYQHQYLSLQSEQERNEFRHRHETRMRLRADAQGVALPDPVQLQPRNQEGQAVAGKTDSGGQGSDNGNDSGGGGGSGGSGNSDNSGGSSGGGGGKGGGNSGRGGGGR
jgi:hypothetical protein